MRQDNPKFSVIVPIYNEQRYLAKCIESLRNQTLEDIEIILVDDGSTDRSGLIADWYARQDRRIRVFHKENGGQGPARNLGMKAAKGEYIGFADADDWVEREMFQKLYERAEQTHADIVFTGFKIVSHGRVREVYKYQHSFKDSLLLGQHDLSNYRCHLYGPESSGKTDEIPGYVFTGGFRRSFIAANHLRFSNMMSEDNIFLIQAFQAVRCVSFIVGALYCYRRDNQVSTTNSFKAGSIDSYQSYMKAALQLLKNEPSEQKHECLCRWEINVINISRELVHRIENSSLPSSKKSDYIHQVNMSPFLKEISSHYSWRKLNPIYILFYWAQINDVVLLERLMIRIWMELSVIKQLYLNLLPQR